MKTCENCKFAVFEEYGYSNYTVEGTTFFCARKAHPKGSFDRWYGENPDLNFAAECQSFVEGNPVEIDCDHDCEGDLTPEERQIVTDAGVELWGIS